MVAKTFYSGIRVSDDIRMTSNTGVGRTLVLPPCMAGRHFACAHPGSKPDIVKQKNRRRAKNKVARRSRAINRSRS